MPRFQVRFYYGTDLRTEQVITAHDEVRALAAALDAVRLESWATGAMLRLEIIRL
jgi:hypothetical protein